MSFRDAQADVHTWISQFQEGYWKPLAMMARITEEVGELAREVNHSYGQKPKKATEEEGSIGEEIADTLFVLLALANSLQIDLDAAFARAMKKYRTRDGKRWTPKRKPGLKKGRSKSGDRSS